MCSVHPVQRSLLFWQFSLPAKKDFLSKAHLAHLSFAGNLPAAQIHSRGSISVWRRAGWTGWSMAFGCSLISHPDPKVSRQGGSSRPKLWTWLLRSLQVGKLNSPISILMSEWGFQLPVCLTTCLGFIWFLKALTFPLQSQWGNWLETQKSPKIPKKIHKCKDLQN